MKDIKKYVEALDSTTCACGRPKERKKSFCWACYRRLPRRMREALYSKIGRGYEGAVDAALELLGLSEEAA